jgi:hypothetical protein
MQPGSEAAHRDAREAPDTRLSRAVGIVAYALLYAGAIALLVIFAPSEPHVFIYQGF